MKYAVRPFQIDALTPPTAPPPPGEWLTAASLDLEIGCGVGWHPIRYALAHRERRLIAIEHTRAKFERFQSRLSAHAEITNLLAVHADAIRWTAHHLPPATLDRCILMYPNPEPKAANKRWFRSPFMHRLLETLKPGGEIWLATNEEWYWTEAKEWSERAWGLAVVEARSFTQKEMPPSQARTHFEKKYLARGETCYELRVRLPALNLQPRTPPPRR